MRYGQLEDIVNEMLPHTIVEIGTHSGERAVLFLKYCRVYHGFDLFEEASNETDKREFNVKQHHSMEDVSKRIVSGLNGQNKNALFLLYKGDTRETLETFNATIDFAFIDGGHSIETIRSDWLNLKPLMNRLGCVVFDDYYTGMPKEFTDKFGCNGIMDDLDNYLILPAKDHVKGGGFVQMVKVVIN